MRFFPINMFLLSFLIVPAILNAQTGTETTSIFDDLQKTDGQKGQVTVTQSDEIRRMVGVRRVNIGESNQGYLKVQGFRTQVFSDNNQKRSKAEAFKREREILDLFPDLTTYVTYNAPFWKLRVGDFRTREEAFQMMKKLMEAFPSYGKEMYIVKEEVNIPLND